MNFEKYKRIKLFKYIFSLIVFLLYLASPIVSNNIIYAATEIIRNEKTNLYIESATKSAKVEIIRDVSVKGPSWLVLPANSNSEVFSICSTNTEFKDAKNVLRTISVTSGSRKLQYTNETKGNCIIVKVRYPHNLTVYNPIHIKVAFNTNEYVSLLGGVLEVLYPGFSKDTKFKSSISASIGTVVRFYNPTINFFVSKNLGPITLVTPNKQVKQDNGFNLVSFSGRDLVEKSVRVLVGSKRYVKFSITTDVGQTNLSTPEFLKKYVTNDIELILPQDDTLYGQSVLFTKFDPMPFKVWKDSYGNMRALFRLPAGFSGKITVSGLATINFKKKDLALVKNFKIVDIDKKQFTRELQQSLPYWDTQNSEIQNLANELKDDSDNVYQTLINDLEYIVKNMTYVDGIAFSNITRKGAVEALKTKSGVCMEYSDLLITLLRAQGIPARAAVGNALGSLADAPSKEFGHQWAEVYLPPLGWVQVDPTWSTKQDLLIGPDLDHFLHYRVADSDHFDTIICKTYDIASGNKICSNYKLTVEEVNNPKAIIEDASVIPAQELENRINSSYKEVSVLERYLQEIGSSPIGRLVFSTIGFYVILFIIVIIAINIIIWLWKVILKPRSPNTY